MARVVDFERARCRKVNSEITNGLQEIEQLNEQIRQLYFCIHCEIEKMKAHAQALSELEEHRDH
ncbi:MAG: hypothetical protein ACPG4U_04020 [Pseudomonadales bacterium]